jgi:hypothetical protein
MERRTKYGISLLIFLILGLSIYGLVQHLDAAATTLTRAEVRTSAPLLAASFESNEVLADSLYLNKVISVSGVVQNVAGDGRGNLIARLAGDRNGKIMVDCLLDSGYRPDEQAIQPGDSVTIRGTCAGQWKNVILLQCIMENQ